MAEVDSVLEPIASIVQRLAVLLAAGVAPGSAWGYLAEAAPADARLAAIARAAGDGRIADAILATLDPAGPPAEPRGLGTHPSQNRQSSSADSAAWRAVAAAWLIATDAGAPLAGSLGNLAESLRDLARIQRELRVALAGPKATAKLVMVLPVVGLGFGMILGFDTLGTLLGTVPGWCCLALGVAMMALARSWNRRLLRSAEPGSITPGLGLSLVAIAVSGGASIELAIESVEAARRYCGMDARGESAAVEQVLALSRRAGVPAAALLRSEAAQARRNARSDGEEKAAALAVRLMLPLGLCVLPAFMVLGVVPLMIAVISSTVGAG